MFSILPPMCSKTNSKFYLPKLLYGSFLESQDIRIKFMLPRTKTAMGGGGRFPLVFSEGAQSIQSIAQSQGTPTLQDKCTTTFLHEEIRPPLLNWDDF